MSLEFKKHFTKNANPHVFGMFEWEKFNLDINDDTGRPLFTQKDVEFPIQWSSLAKKITASKYFFGDINERESSLRQLIDRVTKTMAAWGLKQKYFETQVDAKNFQDELAYLTLAQKMAFNSPVWFNVGIHLYGEDNNKEQRERYIITEEGEVVLIPIGGERSFPQTSACFIQSVEDTMEDIMDLARREALIFKYGSGTGTNLSSLRSSKENLSGGGKPSGPLAYWSFYDKVAGIVKSGGKTRRAAKMDILNIEHPDILEFINSKKQEEKKMHILIDNGIPWMEAVESCNFQNTNISVRVSDEFMKAVVEDNEWLTTPVHSKELVDEMPKFKARFLLNQIAESTHFCGDPGIQFDTIINKWHTCPNSAKINSSNPCSEYMFVDNSSCNLASLNLLKFLDEDNTFNVEDFSKAIRITAIAQDLEIDNSSYPTSKIAENSHKFRPLGMGYANLGSLLMFLGIPYDSEEGRAIAGTITALLTGKVYETSTELAEKIGTFEEFEKNKEPMLNVMKMHRESLKNISKEKLPKEFHEVLVEAEKTWNNVIGRGEDFGFRNAQATVLAPTGTIGFMMDCDTKGVEPEIGLVQTKLLADGGILKLVNSTVEPALKRLEYTEEEISQIVEHIKGTETIEGSIIKEEHLPAFDCANKPSKGTRTISYMGHLKMMSAVQPFISGAISKTVNLPKEVSTEEIEEIYITAWKLGIKAVALYRDQSKRIQPLNFKKKKKEQSFKPMRKKLPTTRNSLTHKFDIAGYEGYITIGLYDDGMPGETFITMNKEGSIIGGLMDGFATSISMNLQYGVPLKDLISKFKHQRFEPKGIVWEGHPEIKTADSVIDYIFKFLEKEFLEKKVEPVKKEKEETKKESKDSGEEIEVSEGELGGICPVCGEQLIKKGHCNETCPKCKFENQNGCGA